MLSKAEKDKKNWKEINKVSMTKFKQAKYLLLALTTLYTPVTRNAIQMALCAPKYHYAKYDCMVQPKEGAAFKKDSSFFLNTDPFFEHDDKESMCLNATLSARAAYRAPTTGTNTNKAACSTITSTSTPSLSDICLPNNLTPCQKAGCTDYTGKLKSSTSTKSISQVLCAGETCAKTDVKTCCAVQVDNKGFYEFTSKKDCDANGRNQITSVSECQRAATALGYSTTISETRTSFDPRGCYYDSVSNKLMYNPFTGTVSKSCDSNHKCFCGSAQSDADVCDGITSFTIQEISGNDCAANGRVEISSAAECKCAANAMKVSAADVTYKVGNDNKDTINMPKGCSYKSGNLNDDGLVFNKETTNTDACSVGRKCYCKKTRRRHLTASKIYTEKKKDGTGTYQSRIDLKIAAAYPRCYEGDHGWMTVLSVVVLFAFSLYFPFLMNKVINFEKPQPLSPDDPGKKIIQKIEEKNNYVMVVVFLCCQL